MCVCLWAGCELCHLHAHFWISLYAHCKSSYSSVIRSSSSRERALAPVQLHVLPVAFHTHLLGATRINRLTHTYLEVAFVLVCTLCEALYLTVNRKKRKEEAPLLHFQSVAE